MYSIKNRNGEKKMDNIAVVILLLFLGIIIGGVLVLIINHLRGISAQGNANKL